MLVAPPWSHTPPTFGCSSIASASVCPYIDWYFEVGTLTNSASTADLSMPASASALRQASTFIETVPRPGSRPNCVCPMPAMTYLPRIRSRLPSTSRATSSRDRPSQPSTSSLLAPSVLLGSCASGGAPS